MWKKNNSINNNDNKSNKSNETFSEKGNLKIDEYEQQNKEIIFYENEIESQKNVDINFDNNIDNNIKEENSSSSSFQSHRSSSVAKTNIFIIYDNVKYPFKIKNNYKFIKILYRFTNQFKNLKPKGKFSYKGDEINDLSKTCEDLGIKEDAELKLI